MSNRQTTKICDQIKITFTDDGYGPYFDEDKDSRNIYRIHVNFKGKKTSFRFGDSIANTEDSKTPESDPKEYKLGMLETIVNDYTLTPEYYPTYHDFSSEFGYDEDSIKGLKAYKRCMKQGEKLHKLFNDADIEKIREELDL